MERPHLSVIIPCFNEGLRLGPSLEKITHFLRNRNYESEIIVVDDGSSDQTVDVARAKLQGFQHEIIEESVNRGKGNAVRKGMLVANGDFLMFTDADLSTPIDEVEKLIKALQDGFQVAIGSRALPGSQVEIHQNIIRELMGKAFNKIARFASFKGIKDSQCGFKCFRREAAQELFGQQKINGFSFDAEILFLAQKRNYKIAEVPVVWRNSPNSRVHILKDSLRMLLDVFRIPWLHR